MTTAKGMIGALVENPRVLSLANWAWGSSDIIIAGGSSSSVTPSSCLESLPLLSSPCLSRLVAKCVGICIILASCANKAPVIRNVVRSGSVAGLSVVAIYGEIALYSNAAFYNILRGNPFSAYGETLTVLLQTMIVAALLWLYDARRGWRDAAIALVAYCAYLFVVFFVLTPKTQFVLMVYNPIVLVGTRGAQIRENYANKQTGAQSIATISMNLASGLVRIATTIKEIGFDFHILRSYGTSVLLNLILFAQIMMYRSNTELFLERLRDKKKE